MSSWAESGMPAVLNRCRRRDGLGHQDLVDWRPLSIFEVPTPRMAVAVITALCCPLIDLDAGGVRNKGRKRHRVQRIWASGIRRLKNAG